MYKKPFPTFCNEQILKVQDRILGAIEDAITGKIDRQKGRWIIPYRHIEGEKVNLDISNKFLVTFFDF
jgi:hypothetical protein